MASFSMILPELPKYLSDLGGEKYIGFIVGLFTMSALLSRFFSGRISDRVGRVWVMIFGSIVTISCGLGYLLVWSIPSFLFLRFIHGLSTGFRPVGSTTYLTDIVPPSRRGEALGFLGIAGSTGMALGPVLGSVLAVEFGYNSMFIASALLGVISLLITLKLPETLENPEKLAWKHVNVFKGQILDWSSWPAAVFLLPVCFAFGVFLTVSPDFVESLGFKYKGLFNGIIVVSSILTRLFAGKVSDTYGRIPVLRAGMVLLVIGMALIASADSVLSVSIAGFVYGISVGINMPTVFAWTTDLAKPGKIGLALATMLLSLELGIGLGAFSSGQYYAGDLSHIPHAYWACTGFGVLGLIFIFSRKPRKGTR